MNGKIKVGPVDPTKYTSEIAGDFVKDDSLTSTATATEAGCLYNGIRYSNGSRICADGTFLYCNADGTWSPGGSC